MLSSVVCTRTPKGFCPQMHARGQTQMWDGESPPCLLNSVQHSRSKHTCLISVQSSDGRRQARKSSCTGQPGKAKEVTLDCLLRIGHVKAPLLSYTHLPWCTGRNHLYAKGGLLEMQTSDNLVGKYIGASPCIPSFGVRRG